MSHKKQAVVSPSDDLNNLLNDTTISQSTSTKRGHKKKQQEEIDMPLPLNNYDNNTQSKNKRRHKKKHKMVASQTSQIITELLKDGNSKKSMFEELVLKIFKCELNSAEGIESVTGLLQKEEIIIFVNESATEKVLGRWLNATNMDELKAQNSIYHLYKLI
ncbi:20680_t:CDS:2 [Racocetra persica]|uniref:20680_t:CDS:1 n=1 Tax=Racocetra persica TaxID=160502 RepID=A0ACA9LM56_9GLOM|nr:20680_t:CDS:2 [Racocetra persica]